MIDDLIHAAAGQSGLTPVQVRRSLTGALGLIDKHAEPTKKDELYAAVPGAQELATAGVREIGSGGGGLLGGLMKAAGGAQGSALADGKAMLDRLKREGVSQDELKRLLPIVMEQVRERAGGRDLLREVVGTIPGVGGMLGGR